MTDLHYAREIRDGMTKHAYIPTQRLPDGNHTVTMPVELAHDLLTAAGWNLQ